MCAVLAFLAGACSNLGLGEPECDTQTRDATSANILSAQAVPSARYTPCLDELKLGWGGVLFSAEDGEAGLAINSLNEFATTPIIKATVTEACDTSGAIPVPSGHPDIERFEDVAFEAPEIGVTIIPAGRGTLVWARLVAQDYAAEEIDDRPIVFTVDENMNQSVGGRINVALFRNQYVWIIGEIDAEEQTVELRSPTSPEIVRGISFDKALDHMEASVTDVYYRGNWYFLFDGGCITYEFDATGRTAETIAADAEEALGFYPAYQLREGARDLGFNIEGNTGKDQ